jgi:hypothetical protein
MSYVSIYMWLHLFVLANPKISLIISWFPQISGMIQSYISIITPLSFMRPSHPNVPKPCVPQREMNSTIASGNGNDRTPRDLRFIPSDGVGKALASS